MLTILDDAGQRRCFAYIAIEATLHDGPRPFFGTAHDIHTYNITI